MNTANPNIKIGIVFLGRRRPGFDMEWGRLMETRVRESLGKSGFDFFEPAEKAIDDASLRRVLAECAARQIDALVLLQTTMGDARLSQTIAQLWPDPLILWATPEKPDGDMISSCSLVGAHCWASVLRHMGHAFEVVYGDPDAAGTRAQFSEAVRLAVTVRRLKQLRLGLIGGQAPGYFALGADPFLMHRAMGVQVQSYSLVDFFNAANDVSAEAVTADVGKVKSLGIPHKDTTDEDLPVASRLYLAIKSFFESENLGALSIREWPEMPNVFGQWPYLAVARLVDEGLAVGIEGDADGALGAWLVESLGLGRCYLSDWLEHDEQTITLWHGGAAPMSLCEPVGQPGGPRIARHFNIKKPAVMEATLRAGMPVTVYRFWRCDGSYFLTAREGETIKPRRHLMATNGLVKMECDPRAWFDEICHAGMPHHVAVVQGHQAALLKRLARALNLQVI
jgi:L-fucose isomerase-like protein